MYRSGSMLIKFEIIKDSDPLFRFTVDSQVSIYEEQQWLYE